MRTAALVVLVLLAGFGLFHSGLVVFDRRCTAPRPVIAGLFVAAFAVAVVLGVVAF